MSMTVLSVVGTRPEAIKMAPVIRELEGQSGRIESRVCSTGQHRDLLDPVFRLFGIWPDIELGVMRPGQGLADLTAALFSGLDRVVAETRPDWVLAQGDTTTVFVAAMVAFYRGVPFGHVEAGLRTGDRRRPFPEEINRRLADSVASAYFAPTERARRVLLAEGCPEADVYLTGNPVIDAVREVAARPYDWSTGPLADLPRQVTPVLVTAHRRESFGAPLRELCLAVRDLAHEFAAAGVCFVYPVHPNPRVRDAAIEVLEGAAGVRLVEPLDYLTLIHLLKRSALVLTDSGGLQEEAPGLGVPVLVLRETTERPEGVEAGAVRLVGTDRARIVAETRRLLRDPDPRSSLSLRPDLYGDGQAARRIVAALLDRPRLPRDPPA